MRLNSRRRTWFALLTVVALIAMWVALRTHLQQRTIRAIRASGGNVSVTAHRPDWLAPGKISTFLTDCFRDRTFEVQFANVAATDANLAPLADLAELTWLSLHSTKVEGPGLVVLGDTDHNINRLHDLERFMSQEAPAVELNGD